APAMPLRHRSLLANVMAGFAWRLGRLEEAHSIRRFDDGWKRTLGEPDQTSRGLTNSADVAYTIGRLPAALANAQEALAPALNTTERALEKYALAWSATAQHGMGEIASARENFAAATELEGRPLFSGRGSKFARHHLDLGEIDAARLLADEGLDTANGAGW